MDRDASPARGIPAPAFRLPHETHIGRVRLQVADLTRSLSYYEHVLGMRIVHRTPTTATLAAHGDDTPLIELHARPGARPVPKRGLLGLYHFAILLPDRAALGRFVEHLAAIGEYAGNSDHAVSEALYLTDPDGLGIEVYADRPRDSWRFNGPEMAMTILPLDLGDLVRAAGGIAWTGMPAGTVIGHVHLHVGNITEAAAFYHGALGFDKTVWSYPEALFLSAGGYHHHLGTNTWARGAPSASDDDARLIDWEIVVPDQAAADAAARSVAEAGYVVKAGDGGWRAVDPWGTAVRVVGPR